MVLSSQQSLSAMIKINSLLVGVQSFLSAYVPNISTLSEGSAFFQLRWIAVRMLRSTADGVTPSFAAISGYISFDIPLEVPHSTDIFIASLM